MKKARLLLFPLALLYGLVTRVRNFLYDTNIIKATAFPLPVIAVGNLSVGGTGKSPMIEYLIRLLHKEYHIVTLSRGYKRQTSGFFLADVDTTVEMIGDEPYQYFHKFPYIHVAVDADRVNGVRHIMQQLPQTEVVLLDDAYQHRSIQAGLSILLTSYNDLYADDWLLPAGNLRESRKGAARARIVVVTKCPPDLTEKEQQAVVAKLALQPFQQLFFTTVSYDTHVYNATEKRALVSLPVQDIFAVAGIAKPDYFFDHLGINAASRMVFPDHHPFSAKDIQHIRQAAGEKIILTTEKDYVRLKDSALGGNLYYLPIQTTFIKNTDSFNRLIHDYVGKSTGNR